jgi:hypothetical protein
MKSMAGTLSLSSKKAKLAENKTAARASVYPTHFANNDDYTDKHGWHIDPRQQNTKQAKIIELPRQTNPLCEEVRVQ